jgi:hypothetical protein
MPYVPISSDVTVKPFNSRVKEMFKMKDSTLARKAAMAGMVGAVLWIIGIIWEYTMGLQSSGEGAMYAANELLFIVAMAGIGVARAGPMLMALEAGLGKK